MNVLSKIGCSSLSFRELSLKAALMEMAGLGFSHFDLAMIPPRFCPHFDPLRVGPQTKENLKSLLHEVGLRISTLNVFPGFLDQDSVEYQIAFIRESIILARDVGVPFVTVGGGRQATADEWAVRSTKVVENLRKIADFSDKKGIGLSLEAPHLGTLTNDRESTFRFLELLDDDRIGLTLDTSHAQACGWSSLAQAWHDLGRWVNHIHLRDCRGQNVQVTPGKGEGDFQEFFRRVSSDGYQGDLNIELEFRRFVPFRKFRSLVFRVHRWAFKRRFLRCQFNIRPPKVPTDVKAIRQELIFARRYFSKTLGGGGGEASPGLMPVHQAAGGVISKRETGKVRVAILGCGWAGRIAHGQAIKKMPEAELVGVCDKNMALADMAARELSCPAYYHLGDMVERSGAHLVFNCTREWDHYPTTMELFNAGIDVFCEKILCSRYEDAERLVKKAKRTGRVLGINHNYHKLPGVTLARKAKDDGRFGDISNIDISCHAYCFHHALDVALYLGGPVKSVYSTYEDRTYLRKLPGWERFTDQMLYIPTTGCAVILKHANGGRSCISSSILFQDRQFLMGLNAVFGRARLTVSKITYDDIIGQPFFPESEDMLYEMMDPDYEGGLQRTFDLTVSDFLSRYVRGHELAADGDYTLDVMKLERAVVESNTRGTEVDLEQ